MLLEASHFKANCLNQSQTMKFVVLCLNLYSTSIKPLILLLFLLKPIMKMMSSGLLGFNKNPSNLLRLERNNF